MDITTKVFIINFMVFCSFYVADRALNFDIWDFMDRAVGAWFLLSIASVPVWVIWFVYSL